MLRRFKAVLAAALLCGSAAVYAHNYHMGLADISYNPNTGNTEIVHSYTAHDVEALLMNLYQRQFDLGLEEDQAVLRRYIEKQFTLNSGGKALRLQWIGVSASADNITIYQEIEKTQLAPGTVLRNNVLTDFLPTQINTVNIAPSAAGRAAQTLVFKVPQIEQALP